jgi:uncharacterized integral membrane protein (TIGR00698 family)
MNSLVTIKSRTQGLLYFLVFILCFTPFVSTPVALAAGIVYALVFGNPFPAFTHFTTGWLLKASVVGLGFGMNAYTAAAVSWDVLPLTIVTISITLLLGYVVGRRLKMSRRLSHLVASGTAICGGSAIAAIAPVVKASDEEISVSLATVFLLNSVALMVFPFIGHLLDMSQHDFGLWSAIAIHDTSSVVGAAKVYGNEALGVAVTVKLARSLWIIPVSIISLFIFKGEKDKVGFPYFVAFFVLAMVCNTFFPSFTSGFNSQVVVLARMGLSGSLFLIGSSLSVAKLKSAGWQPLTLGIVLWTTVSVVSLAAIFLF